MRAEVVLDEPGHVPEGEREGAEGEGGEEGEEEDEEEAAARASKEDEPDAATFWATIDQQYCDPSEQGAPLPGRPLPPPAARARISQAPIIVLRQHAPCLLAESAGCCAPADVSTLRNVRAATGPMPDMERPLPGLGEHYIKQWKREADAKLVRTPSNPPADTSRHDALSCCRAFSSVARADEC